MPALITALHDPDLGVRQGATEALGRIGRTGSGSAVEPILITALGDANPEVRKTAAVALGQIKSPTARAMSSLIATLGDAEPEVRRGASEALGQIGPVAVPILLTAPRSTNPKIRQGAAVALGRVEPAAAETVSALIVALGDPDPEVRQHVTWALDTLDRQQPGPSADRAGSRAGYDCCPWHSRVPPRSR